METALPTDFDLELLVHRYGGTIVGLALLLLVIRYVARSYPTLFRIALVAIAVALIDFSCQAVASAEPGSWISALTASPAPVIGFLAIGLLAYLRRRHLALADAREAWAHRVEQAHGHERRRAPPPMRALPQAPSPPQPTRRRP